MAGSPVGTSASASATVSPICVYALTGQMVTREKTPKYPSEGYCVHPLA
jgi:hypothetical protein